MTNQIKAREISVGDVLASGRTVTAVQDLGASFVVISTTPEPRYTSDGALRGKAYKLSQWVAISASTLTGV